MKFSLATFGLASLVASAAAMSVSYDTGYDDPNRSMGVVSCSDGPNGLMHRFPTQGAIPNFPRIGGLSGIAWNSAQCGSCHKITYNGKSIFVVAIDSSSTGFNIGLTAMNELTNNQATSLGRIEAEVTNASPSDCRM
ncbi:hypothetical protein IAQ61_007200 [Plenodomus lingam]|uniref:Secreted protein 1 n=1 Tax=Leptosphaeria maculans TaxID=5022 RepID=Q8J0U4_LEPMC|nr:secreted protein 1 [Plenodomus lingam]KAH9867896.1 hypothetical protein IAQ61_007200 [Plenodomus lingam]